MHMQPVPPYPYVQCYAPLLLVAEVRAGIHIVGVWPATQMFQTIRVLMKKAPEGAQHQHLRGQ